MASQSLPAQQGVKGELCDELKSLTESFYATDQPIFLKLLKVQAFVSDLQSLSPPLQDCDLDDLIDSIEGEEFPSKRLKLELANLLKRPLIILEYMKKGDEKLLVTRALQFKWMYFDPCSPLTSPKTMTRLVLPSVSFATRRKVIRGLSKYLDCEKSTEKMFSLVEEKYGASYSLELLPSCSAKFIREYLLAGHNNNRHLVFLLDQQQSLRIAKKDYCTAAKMLDIIFDYVKSLEQDKRDESAQELIPEIECNGQKLMRRMKHYHLKTIEYLSFHHTQEFVRLFEKYHGLKFFKEVKAKPSLTRALFRQAKDRILCSGRLYKDIICHKILHKCLTEEEVIDYVVSCLPRERESFFEEFNGIWERIGRLYGNKWKVIAEAFKRKYNMKLDSQEWLPLAIMKVMPSEMKQSLFREKILKMEKANNSMEVFQTWKKEDWEWIVLCDIEEEFVFVPLKEMISQEEMDVESKQHLIELLVESCYINGKNVDKLVNVGRLLLKLNTEGDSDCGGQLRFTFIEALINKFTIPGWEEDPRLLEIQGDFVKIYCVKKDVIHPILLCHREHGELLSEFLSLNELWNLLFHSLKCLRSSYGPKDAKRFQFNEFLQLVLNTCAKKYPEDVPLASLYEQELLDSKLKVILIVQFICRMKLPLNIEQTSSWLKTRILEIVRLDDNLELDCHSILKVVKNNPELYLSCLKELLVFYPEKEVLQYFLRRKPETLYYNIEPVLSFMLSLDTQEFKSYKRILFSIKSRSYSALQCTVSEICLETVQNEGLPESARENAITALSILWDSNNFLHIISLFYPSSPFRTVGQEGNILEDDLMDFQSKYRAKKVVVESFLNTSSPTSCLKPMANFCVGDYLQISLGSLYSICLHAKPSDTIKFLREEFLDSPLTLKKHAVKLLLLLSTREDVEELLSYLWESESHLEIRKILVSNMVNFVGQNSRDGSRIWSSVIRPSLLSLTTVLDSTESESIELLKLLLCPSNIGRISNSFVGEFLQICVNILDLNDDEKTDITRKSLKPYLVRTIRQCLPAISQTQRKFLVKKQYCNEEI